MAKATLMCALVRRGGVDVFSVAIDTSLTVAFLKQEIKGQSDGLITDPWPSLHLFLAKKDGKWLPDDDTVDVVLRSSDVTSYVEIRASEEIGDLFGITLTKGIHVLVVVPNGTDINAKRDRTSVPAAVPMGRHVITSSCDDLFAFLESDMINKEAIISRPHILAPDSLQFRLVGREQAIATASKCFHNIIKHATIPASDRTKVAIPVCSGISSLGKTRMLEEGATILQEMKLDPKHVFHVIVPYFNGFNPQPVEQSMSIQASFSWRLLYRFFLDNNCLYSFQAWFSSRLPSNGAQLRLEDAVKVIERKLRDKLQESVPLYLFLGVDEYQKIERIRAQQSCSSKTSILHELMETITSLLCSQSSSMIVLPMFAGTDLGVIEATSITSSSPYVIERLPMNLLSMDQVFSIVESDASYAGLLKHAQICHYLFILGGVPRWVVDYLMAVKKTCVQGETASLDNIRNCFMQIWSKYVRFYLNSLEISQRVRLAAFAVSGREVQETGQFDGLMKWSKLRDSSMCLLIPSTSGACNVRVPYALLQNIGVSGDDMTSDAERSFATALMDMWDMVDSKMFDLQPWQLWEMFGACFYAVRINALLVLGYSTVTLRDLLPGTRMSFETGTISVKLAPSRVFRCAETFSCSTPRLVFRQGNPLEKVDWTSSGCIAVNGDGETGVDIFFALKDAATDNLVVIVDQRKRQLGKFQPSHAADYFGKLSVCPDFLVRDGARLVRGVMTCVSTSDLEAHVVPHDCFLLSRDETEQFHGTLAYHPACTPAISINSSCKTALKAVLQGTGKEVDEAVEEMLKKRQEPSGGFSNSEELRSFLKVKRLKVQFDDHNAEFSSY